MLAFFRLALAVLRLCWLHWYMIFVFVNVGRENLNLGPASLLSTASFSKIATE